MENYFFTQKLALSQAQIFLFQKPHFHTLADFQLNLQLDFLQDFPAVTNTISLPLAIIQTQDILAILEAAQNQTMKCQNPQANFFQKKTLQNMQETFIV